MTTIEFASETPRITTRPAVAMLVVNAIANSYRAWKNRRAFYRLGEMSDAELADIGLTRGDLHVAPSPCRSAAIRLRSCARSPASAPTRSRTLPVR
ncbi:DUF1127 domain-containing protein [Mesorhizobium atlanticum]